MTTLPSVDHDQVLIDEAILAISRPEGVGKPSIAFGPDHSGDEAAYLTFPVSRKLPLTKARVKQLTALSLDIQRFLYSGNIVRIPYVRFTETR